jgi:RHS repeat-associated protein
MYYASGVPMAESTGRDKQPYLYNGKEFVEAHGLNESDFGNRYLHHTISRFSTMDRFAEKCPWQSPYAYAGNNPINCIDVNGDSLDFSQPQQFDNENETNTVGKILDDHQAETGLSLSLNNGILSYAKNEDGTAIVSENGGSETARNHLISLIDGEQMVHVFVGGSKSFGQDDYIVLNPKQIEKFIQGTVGLDNRTLGWGMTFFHESFHTDLGGGLKDYPNYDGYPGPVEEKMNVIRQELGPNWGQRMTYNAPPMFGQYCIPFNKDAYNLLQKGYHLGGLLPEDVKYIHFSMPK